MAEGVGADDVELLVVDMVLVTDDVVGPELSAAMNSAARSACGPSVIHILVSDDGDQ